ncbi:serine/arginine-rich splicing factor 7-like isoform X5 [Salvelinus fontinalis]|uniref:serine/arginine-rich splicing factor 7 isoform X6 n=1 Tax=Salvelinus sp. IW2-2015 TaxID=2691554 RepID=UPI000CDFB575|nr:serine/arginine-rich splicing factor 7 isoform X6 [Salvelinus alpinus]XP_055797650.1 serine/arginine-rich splicing factor 7-like isoform X5 [Salvelinus fontinalis]
MSYSSSRSSSRNTDCKVYVGDLGNGAAKGELERAFSYYGPLRSVWVARNPPGFAFVEYEDPRDAEDATKGMDGKVLCGARIRVELSTGMSRKSRHDRPSRRHFDPNDRCYQCGENGHYAYDCYRFSKRGGGRRSRSRSRSRSRGRRYRSRSRSNGRDRRSGSPARSKSRSPVRRSSRSPVRRSSRSPVRRSSRSPVRRSSRSPVRRAASRSRSRSRSVSRPRARSVSRSRSRSKSRSATTKRDSRSRSPSQRKSPTPDAD